MKINTDDLKAHLRRALVSAPDDNSLREAKTHILRAIEAIEDVESAARSVNDSMGGRS